MASFTLGPHFDAFVRDMLATGRFNNASETDSPRRAPRSNSRPWASS